MLTSAFYYKLYRPYIVGSRDSGNVTSKRERIAQVTPQEKLDQGMVIVLNKSMKEEIVDYARNVSHGVTGFRSSVRTALSDLNSFSLNAMYNGHEAAMDRVVEDLENLTRTYNESTAYLSYQGQSSDLRSFSQALQERMRQGQDRLELLGLNFDEEEGLRFEPDVLTGLSQLELNSAIGANMQVFHSLNQTTDDVLQEPLSTYMPFRGLSYHYNYQLGRMVEDGFGMIESGMIIDRMV